MGLLKSFSRVSSFYFRIAVVWLWHQKKINEVATDFYQKGGKELPTPLFLPDS